MDFGWTIISTDSSSFSGIYIHSYLHLQSILPHPQDSPEFWVTRMSSCHVWMQLLIAQRWAVPFYPTHTPNRLWQSMAKIQPLKVKFQFWKENGKHNCYCPVAEIKFSWAESAGCPALAGSTILGHCSCWSLLMAVGIALTFVLQNLRFCPSGCSFLLFSVAISFSSVKFSYNNLGFMYSKIHHFWYISLWILTYTYTGVITTTIKKLSSFF